MVSRLALIFFTVAVVDFNFFESTGLALEGLLVVPFPTCDSISDNSTFLNVFLPDFNCFFLSSSFFFDSISLVFLFSISNSSVRSFSFLDCSFSIASLRICSSLALISSFSFFFSFSSNSRCFSRVNKFNFLLAFCCSSILVSWISRLTCSFRYRSTDSLS